MKILITGGAGFIGSNVVDGYISLGHEVAIIDNFLTGKRENVNISAKLYEGDLRDKDFVNFVLGDFGPDIVNHHGAHIDVRKAVEMPLLDAEINVLGSINLFNASVKNRVKRIIFASTGGALYGEPKTLPAKEDIPVNPLSPYGVSKYCAENYLNYFKKLYGIERVILRYANVYGPRQDPLGEAGVVAIFTGRILNNEKPIIYGDGNQTRDYIYVEDVVKANILALDGKEGTYNIGTSIETSVNDLLKMFSKIINKEIQPLYLPPRIGEVQRISLDVSKAKEELGFMPEFSLEDGINKTIEWYKINKRGY